MNDAAGQRTLRKQALRLRAATERVELVQTAGAVRQSAAMFGKATPGLAMGRGLPLALGLLKRAPLLSPLLSLALAGARRPVVRYGVLAAGGAWLAWKGWQWLAAQRRAASGPAQSQPDPDATE
jgi:threonine/homoserine/homoserine lactone efflux protein